MKQILSQRPLPTFSRWSRHNWCAFSSIGREVRIGVLAVSMLFGNVERAWADHSDYEDEEGDTSRLSEIEVIAKRAYPARGTVLSTTIFNGKDLTTLPLQTLESALKTNPAIDVRERGAHGVQADVALYGSNWDQTAILLNGVDFTDPRTGHQSNSLPIDVENISRITATSDIIGSSSYSGAINYMTRFAERQFTKAGVTGGDFGLWRTFLSTGLRYRDATALFSTSFSKCNGYRENTDFNNLNIYAYSTLSPTIKNKSIGDFEIQAGFQRREFGSYGFYSLQYPWQWEQTQTFLSSVRWHWQSDKPYELSAYASYRCNTDLYALYRDGYEAPDWYTGPNNHLTNNYGVGVQADYKWARATSSIGIDYSYNHIYSNVLGYEMEHPKKVHGYPNSYYTRQYDRNIFNFWARQSFRLCRQIHLNASGNIVKSPYGCNVMWGAAVNIHPLRRWNIDLSASRTMRLPTFTDLFYTAPAHVSNPNLSPEFARTLRLGSTYTYRHITLGTNVFYRWGTNIIDWIKKSADGLWEAAQYTSVNTFGVVATATLEWPGEFLRRAQISYGHLNNTNDSGDYMSQFDINFMRNKLSAILDFSLFKDLNLGVVWSYFDRKGVYYDENGVLHSYPNYWLLDARLTYTYRIVHLHVDVNNIFNRTYFDFGGLVMPSRWASAGVTFSF